MPVPQAAPSERPRPEPEDAEDSATPARDDHENAAFSPTEAVGQGYPEESPAATVPDGVENQPREEHPQRDEG